MRWHELNPMQRVLLRRADEAFRACLATNSTEPYDHAEYERQLSLARAALTLATSNPSHAYALEYCFHDSNESMEYYLTQWDLDELVRDYASDEPMRLTFEPVR